MKFKSKFISGLLYLVFLFCLLPVAYFKYQHPAYNFDMLGYMALIVRMDQTKGIEEIHRVAYNTERQVVQADEDQKSIFPCLMLLVRRFSPRHLTSVNENR